MALRIFLDGQLIDTNDHGDISDASITLRNRDTTGDLAYGFSGNLEFYGATMNYIREKLVDTIEAMGNRIEVRVIDDCCGDNTIFEGELNAHSIDWCEGDCKISGSFVEVSDEVRKQHCLKQTYIWDDDVFEKWMLERKRLNEGQKDETLWINPPLPPEWGTTFRTRKHPMIRFCYDPRPAWVKVIILIIGLFLNVILLVLTLIVGVLAIIQNIIHAIVEFFDWIGGGDFDEFPGFESAVVMNDIRNNMNRWIVGCDYGVASPLLREYIENGCKACGMEFRSSILTDPNSPYYNTLLMSMPVGNPTSEYVGWSEENKPLYTVTALLDNLKDTFNGEYFINGNVLLFERKDIFLNMDEWINLSDGLDNPIVEEICYSYTGDSFPAYADIGYIPDGWDNCGNEAKWLYKDIVEWNPDNRYPYMKGAFEKSIPFSPSRYRQDGLSGDILTAFDREFGLIIGSVLLGPLGTLLASDLIKEHWSRYMLLSNSSLSTEKLVIWDKDAVLKEGGDILSNIEYAVVIRKERGINNDNPFGGLFPMETFYYNWPYWVQAEEQGNETVKPNYNVAKGNLYDNFWYIEDSRKPLGKLREYRAKIKRRCGDVKDLKFWKYINLPIGKGTIEEVTISETTIEIKGKV